MIEYFNSFWLGILEDTRLHQHFVDKEQAPFPQVIISVYTLILKYWEFWIKEIRDFEFSAFITDGQILFFFFQNNIMRQRIRTVHLPQKASFHAKFAVIKQAAIITESRVAKDVK